MLPTNNALDRQGIARPSVELKFASPPSLAQSSVIYNAGREPGLLSFYVLLTYSHIF